MPRSHFSQQCSQQCAMVQGVVQQQFKAASNGTSVVFEA
jgi:hypothetical protein